MAALNKEQLEALLNTAVQAQNYRSAAWSRVVEEGRKYAMMKSMGKYIENGVVISVSFGDRKNYEEMFMGNVLRRIEDAFTEDALVGIAVTPPSMVE